MKDLGVAKQILGMRIIRDKVNDTLKLSQSEYVKKVLSRFNMNEAKPVSTTLGSHFKLNKEHSPKTEEERDHMSKVSYALAIGSLIYAMVVNIHITSSNMLSINLHVKFNMCACDKP